MPVARPIAPAVLSITQTINGFTYWKVFSTVSSISELVGMCSSVRTVDGGK